MNMKSLMVLGPLVGLCGSLWLSPALALNTTDCDSLDIHVAPSVASGEVECSRGSKQGGDNGNATVEVIDARASLSILVVTHMAAGVHTYIERDGLENYISRITRFAKTDGWTLAPARQSYLVSRFTATFEAGMPSVPCFAFGRYEGHVAQSPGYRHFVAGWYCDFLGTEVLDARINEVLGAITDDF
jgi:hypothetical protein